MSEDTHDSCIFCLEQSTHSQFLRGAALGIVDSFHYGHSCLALFKEAAQACVPHGSGPAAVKAQLGFRSWGPQIDLSASKI